jgi:hypothetical protein
METTSHKKGNVVNGVNIKNEISDLNIINSLSKSPLHYNTIEYKNSEKNCLQYCISCCNLSSKSKISPTNKELTPTAVKKLDSFRCLTPKASPRSEVL